MALSKYNNYKNYYEKKFEYTKYSSEAIKKEGKIRK
jgi:hypothetical protein